MTDQAREHLKEADAAPERLTDATYGICEHCHTPINPARLGTRPTVRTCVQHAPTRGSQAMTATPSQGPNLPHDQPPMTTGI
ncbi:TraR/DksA C4-type zinc finger protein [Ornithinimicrobium sufpigmenti]|uniref:TraR/DksA family transcriptional regulator n=1 Tax=Ornithinimicrobium sufpigmenti TaxID=2508882 RepID=UPI00192E1355